MAGYGKVHEMKKKKNEEIFSKLCSLVWIGWRDLLQI